MMHGQENASDQSNNQHGDKFRKRKFILFLEHSLFTRLLLIGLLSLIFNYFRNLVVDPKDYLLGTAQTQTMTAKILADGRVHAYKTVLVGAQVSGQLQKLHVKLGDKDDD